jgi:pyruvate/2-oxoglutarate dehydrogenase complex dihydrolipoamide acyltransferase (E2) component
VVAGEIRVRRILSMGVLADHFLIDGSDVARAMEDLREMIESPRLLEADGDGG